LGFLSARVETSAISQSSLWAHYGRPAELVDALKAYAYFRALTAASPRVRVFTIGKSEEGRDILLLAIADEQGIAGLEKLKSATAGLADPRKIDLNPVSNPDGKDKQLEWFYRYLKGKTDEDTLPRQAPPYWGKYVFVDINRDAHQLTQETTKAVARIRSLAAVMSLLSTSTRCTGV
jgi:hypothetical protein